MHVSSSSPLVALCIISIYIHIHIYIIYMSVLLSLHSSADSEHTSMPRLTCHVPSSPLPCLRLYAYQDDFAMFRVLSFVLPTYNTKSSHEPCAASLLSLFSGHGRLKTILRRLEELGLPKLEAPALVNVIEGRLYNIFNI